MRRAFYCKFLLDQLNFTDDREFVSFLAYDAQNRQNARDQHDQAEHAAQNTEQCSQKCNGTEQPCKNPENNFAYDDRQQNDQSLVCMKFCKFVVRINDQRQKKQYSE